MPIVTLLLLTAVAIDSPQALSDAPIRTEFCTLVKSPGDFNGKTVVVRARLTKLKNGEWGLDSHCFEPILLAFPANVVPKPDYDVAVTPAFEIMLKSQRERRVFFAADFVGRFDVSDGPSSGRGRSQGAFGKSRLRMRLVLREVTEPERIVVPRR
jgi:hypothetical protein